MSEPSHFRLCTTCKTPIPFSAKYYACSVSTCNRRATAMYFCSVPCWDAHVPEARHRDAWAEVETAPSREEWLRERAKSAESASSPERTPSPRSAEAPRGGEPVRRIVSGHQPSAPRAGLAQGSAGDEDADDAALPRDVLVVVSKLKAYVRARSSMNTSDGVVEVLSDHLRTLCKAAIRSAAANSRKTVLARDFEAVLQGRAAADE
ncbi:MAG: hypothetical protein GX607_14810 [Myxococcales bacterium]|nr:hypothetical protein [Myxococcales bacterium]